MRVQVKYSVPVYAEMTLETGTVERVVVDDEHVSGPDRRGDLLNAETGQIADRAAADRAVPIAESTAWPAWEFGS